VLYSGPEIDDAGTGHLLLLLPIFRLVLHLDEAHSYTIAKTTTLNAISLTTRADDSCVRSDVSVKVVTVNARHGSLVRGSLRQLC
jgi:hypothetical protein